MYSFFVYLFSHQLLGQGCALGVDNGRPSPAWLTQVLTQNKKSGYGLHAHNRRLLPPNSAYSIHNSPQCTRHHAFFYLPNIRDQEAVGSTPITPTKNVRILGCGLFLSGVTRSRTGRRLASRKKRHSVAFFSLRETPVTPTTFFWRCIVLYYDNFAFISQHILSLTQV